jgi:hypothetical protein
MTDTKWAARYGPPSSLSEGDGIAAMEAAARRMPASFGMSPCASVVMTQQGHGPVTRKRTSSPIEIVWSIHSFSTKSCA